MRMIVVEQKPLEEILKMIQGFKNILVVGCDGCAGIYQVGGEKQTEVLKALLGMGQKIKSKIEIKIDTAMVLRQCDLDMVETTLKPLAEKYEALVSLACGVGVQTLAQVLEDKVVIPATNTRFIGMRDQEANKFYELCSACGECILFETGGICPITRCGKSLLNGPCGGQALGKCEVGGWKKDCAWVLIYNRLKERNMLEYFTKFREPRDFRIRQGPREMGG
jgi:hypothetical protein